LLLLRLLLLLLLLLMLREGCGAAPGGLSVLVTPLQLLLLLALLELLLLLLLVRWCWCCCGWVLVLVLQLAPCMGDTASAASSASKVKSNSGAMPPDGVCERPRVSPAPSPLALAGPSEPSPPEAFCGVRTPHLARNCPPRADRTWLKGELGRKRGENSWL